MAMKGYSAFPKVPAFLEPRHQIDQCYIQETRWGRGSYPSAEIQLVNSTTPADWACPGEAAMGNIGNHMDVRWLAVDGYMVFETVLD